MELCDFPLEFEFSAKRMVLMFLQDFVIIWLMDHGLIHWILSRKYTVVYNNMQCVVFNDLQFYITSIFGVDVFVFLKLFCVIGRMFGVHYSWILSLIGNAVGCNPGAESED